MGWKGEAIQCVAFFICILYLLVLELIFHSGININVAITMSSFYILTLIIQINFDLLTVLKVLEEDIFVCGSFFH